MKSKIHEMQSRPLLTWVAIVYVWSEAVILGYAWLSGDYPWDLSLTVSRYIGLYRWTSLFYLLCAVPICLFLAICIAKTTIGKGRKLLYDLIFLCILGCAIFPCNWDFSRLATEIHDIFSYILALLVTVSFPCMAIFAKNKTQRIYGICGALYAAAFLTAFALDAAILEQGILIWENLLIVLLFFEVYLEAAAPARQVAA